LDCREKHRNITDRSGHRVRADSIQDMVQLAAKSNRIARPGDMPRYFEDETIDMRAGLKRGFTPRRVTLAGRDASIVSMAEGKSPQDAAHCALFGIMPGKCIGVR
jgi:hypothetical protein